MVLPDAGRREDGPGKRQQHSHSPRPRRTGDGDGAGQIAGTVRRVGVGRLLRSGEHHRAGIIVGEVNEIGRFLHRVRTVSDHDAQHLRVGQGFPDPGADGNHVVDCQQVRTFPENVDHADRMGRRDPHAGEHLLPRVGRHGGSPGLGRTGGNGSSRGQQHHVGADQIFDCHFHSVCSASVSGRLPNRLGCWLKVIPAMFPAGAPGSFKGVNTSPPSAGIPATQSIGYAV